MVAVVEDNGKLRDRLAGLEANCTAETGALQAKIGILEDKLWACRTNEAIQTFLIDGCLLAFLANQSLRWVRALHAVLYGRAAARPAT